LLSAYIEPMKKTKLHPALLIIVSLIATLTVQAQEKNFGLTEFKNLIQTQNVTTVDQLIPLLPEVLRNNAVFVYESHGLHSERATPQTPRVILFNEDASLIMAFTKNPGADAIRAGEDSVEILHFDSDVKKFETVEITLNGQDEPISKGLVQVNPTACVGCHTSNPRPIFFEYNNWPGMFGSFSDRGYATNGTPEFTFVENFLNQKVGLSRYKDLIYDGFKKNAFGYRISSKNKGDDYSTPTLLLGEKIEDLMFKRMAAKFISSPDYKTMAPLISYLGAPNSELYCGPVRDRYQRIINEVYTESQKQDLKVLINAISAQVLKDSNYKKSIFNLYNKPNDDGDIRGAINLIYSNLFIDGDPFFSVNKPAFELELGLLESIAQKLGWVDSDITTHNFLPTVGFSHVHIGNLYDDEQYFQGLVKELLIQDPDFQKNYYKDSGCYTHFVDAKAVLKSIGVGTTKAGVLFTSPSPAQ
jgi:hypothetical protein